VLRRVLRLQFKPASQNQTRPRFELILMRDSATALGAFVACLVECFKQVIYLCFDAVCIGLLGASLMFPWRWGGAFRALGKCSCDDDDRWKFRGLAAANFFYGVAETLSLVVGLISLCSGLRTRKLLIKLTRNNFAAWDIDDDDGVPFFGDACEVAWGQFGSLLLDLLVAPVFVVVLCSGWRTRILLEKVSEAKGREKVFKVLGQGGALLADLPPLFCGALVTATLWRAPLLWCGPLPDPFHTSPTHSFLVWTGAASSRPTRRGSAASWRSSRRRSWPATCPSLRCAR
jgi:hypothetical protein